MLCVDAGVTGELWLDNVFDREQIDLDDLDRSLLAQLFETTRGQLEDFDLQSGTPKQVH